MLVLSRKQGQSIVIADKIIVNVVEIGRGRVQIGVSAPAQMTIHREEIHQRIQLERMGGGKAGSVTADVPALIVQCVGSQ